MAVENSPARIGKTVVIRGEVKGSEDLIVDGRVEGTVSLSESRLTIGATANVAADLSAKDVLVLGQVQGNIVASGRVELRAGCAVDGDQQDGRRLPSRQQGGGQTLGIVQPYLQRGRRRNGHADRSGATAGRDAHRSWPLIQPFARIQ